MTNQNKYKALAKSIIKTIQKFQNIFIFHHINPDGDCLGAQFGLKLWLNEVFPNKNIYSIGNNEGLFNFLEWNFENDKIKNEIMNDTLAIMVDGSKNERIIFKDFFDLIPNKIIIDHHLKDYSNDENNNLINFIDDSYSSSCEQIAHLIYLTKPKTINKKIATYIYLGIYTDSGRFFYDKTSARTHFLSAWLFNTGFDYDFIHKNLSKRNKKEIRFLKDVLNNYQTNKNVIYYFISWERAQEMKLEKNERNRVDFLANIEGFNIWIFFIENEDKTVRVRLRSNEKNVNQLAKKYGGGGHEKASGAIIESKELIEEFVDKATKI